MTKPTCPVCASDDMVRKEKIREEIVRVLEASIKTAKRETEEKVNQLYREIINTWDTHTTDINQFVEEQDSNSEYIEV